MKIQTKLTKVGISHGLSFQALKLIIIKLKEMVAKRGFPKRVSLFWAQNSVRVLV